MKKERREKVVFEDVFVSVDGNEFKTEKDCLGWEKFYKGILEASWKLVKKVKVDGDKLGLPYASEDDECYILKPKNLEEITLINAYLASVSYGNRTWLASEHVGKTIAFNFGYSREFCHVHDLSKNLEKIKAYTSKMENLLSEMLNEQSGDLNEKQG